MGPALPDVPIGARAIEVAAMLGDSVVHVKHCMDPRDGRVQRATWGLAAATAVCLLAAGLAFVSSVATAADNARAQDRWTRVEHRPERAFRPRPVARATEGAAFGGLALGLAGAVVVLGRLRRERTSPYYRIGTAPGVELAIEGAPLPAFPLVAPSGDDFVFHHGAGIDGELLLAGEVTPLGELAALGRARASARFAGAVEVPIPPNARIRARAGQTTFVVSSVARPRRHAAPLWARLENRALAYVGGSLVVHLAAWALLQLVPPEASSISLETLSVEELRIRASIASRLDPLRPQAEGDRDGAGSGGDEATGLPAMALPQGTIGHPDARTPDGRLEIARTDDPPRLSREDAIRLALRDGILGSDQLLVGVKALAADSDLASGWDETTVLGGPLGPDGEGRGSFGGSVSGLGVSGSCGAETCAGVITASRYATIFTGPHAGGRYGLPGVPGPHERPHIAIVPRVGEPSVGPGYDKTIVHRYIRRRIDQISYCYEKQLLARPGLDVEVMATFLIAPSGAVQSSRGAGGDDAVAGCVAAVVQTITFPPPGSGGAIEVRYPFHFRPAT